MGWDLVMGLKIEWGSDTGQGLNGSEVEWGLLIRIPHITWS